MKPPFQAAETVPLTSVISGVRAGLPDCPLLSSKKRASSAGLPLAHRLGSRAGYPQTGWGDGALAPSPRWAQQRQRQIQVTEDAGPEKANTPTEPLIMGPMSVAAELLPGARPASHSQGACDTSRPGRGRRAGRSRPGQEAANGQDCRQHSQHGQRKQGPQPSPSQAGGSGLWAGARMVGDGRLSSLSSGCTPT